MPVEEMCKVYPGWFAGFDGAGAEKRFFTRHSNILVDQTRPGFALMPLKILAPICSGERVGELAEGKKTG